MVYTLCFGHSVYLFSRITPSKMTRAGRLEECDSVQDRIQ